MVSNWAEQILEAAQLLLVSAALGYTCYRVTARNRFTPPTWSRLRLRLPGGMARGTLLERSESGWEIGPVIQRSGCAAPRLGDVVVVELPRQGGVSHFRSRVSVVGESTITIEPPKRMFKKERRRNERRVDVSDWPATLDGMTAQLLDISCHGARLSGITGKSKAERAEFVLGSHQCACWILEAERDMARIIFEEPLAPRLLKSKTAPLF